MASRPAHAGESSPASTLNAVTSLIASRASRGASHTATATSHSNASNKDLRTLNNKRSVIGYATVICAVICIFTIYHWARFFYRRRRVSCKTGPLTKAARYARSICLRKVPFGFQSVGHLVIYSLFIILQVVLLFWNIYVDDTIQLSQRLQAYGQRSGRLAAANMCLLTFLALKNTPLAFLTAYSYNYLNILHRLAGWTTLLMVCLHMILYILSYHLRGNMDALCSPRIVWGEVAAGCAFVMCVLSVFRRRMYEIFYIAHVSLFIVLVVGIGLHRPGLSRWLIWFCVFMGIAWSTDRILRLFMLVYYAPGNNATLMPLGCGGVKVTLKRKVKLCKSGTSHVYLWIPAIRPFETHPFTVVSAEPLELVIKGHDGFTRDLVRYANNHPGAVLRSSIQGPYNSLAHLGDFSHLVFVAGGSGASFTFGSAIQALRLAKSKGKSVHIDFVWSVRHKEQLRWFIRDLEILRSSSFVNLVLHDTSCTSSSSSVISANGSPALSRAGSDLEKSIVSVDVMPADLVLRSGRPDLPALIGESIQNIDRSVASRVLIAACGPVMMLDTVREVGRHAVKSCDTAVEVHLEAFGW